MNVIGFVDGSYKNNNNTESAGIGGYLYGKEGKVLFIFSGPIDTKSAFDTGLEAVSYTHLTLPTIYSV